MTNIIKKYLSCPIFVCGAIFIISVTSLAMALIAEHIFSLEPCILCIYQRIPFVITALTGLTGLIMSYSPHRLKIVAGLVFISSLTFLAGGIIATYHTGVELHWWTSHLEGCAVEFGNGQELLAMIESTQAARCDEIPWADPIIGLSMANYNALMSFGLFAICLSSTILMTRRANGF